MKFCQSCGNELAEGAKFCPKCGAAVQPESAKSAEPAVERTTAPELDEAVHRGAEQASASTQQTAEAPKSAQAATANPDQPQLGFVGSIQYIMQHAFDFNGGEPESRKSVFWWGFLGVFLLNFAFAFIPILGTLLCWASSILLVSAVMRRLDYLGQGRGIGWFVLIPLVSIYPLVLMFMDKKVA
ncbi:zinc-ribbon domain-containing protein [Levilactobacillus brevis]|uniref:zinc-ribbon domain-containing protein n=1 Tax=Levilactobacillus brevis TaxID=1580 RepID=UPI001119665D|nr:zinc-ribbon domain-containing protein [Levilactobacillus brevis]QCZ46809.1 Hypothetical protein UCCLB556_1932 [Levilactobacillus brevis]